MQIDITKLLNGYIDTYEIKNEINIPKDYLNDSLIYNLNNTTLDGKIIFDEEENLLLVGTISGVMILKDDVTLEEVNYNFTAEIEEILDKSKNILDITEILWQNILMEIPSKVHKTEEEIELSGNGWRVISEETYNQEKKVTNNPFSNLEELLNIKEEK